ncbi:MAG: MMPL family transporter [Deltaproteobacteria bacterium]|nr:MMPL family transporter [Deltaproteobacteria bacterium]
MIAWLMRIVARLPLNHPKAILAAAALLTAVSAVFVPRLVISTDRNLLAGKNDPTVRRRDEVNEIFGTALVAAVVIAGKDDPAEVQKAADELAQALAGHDKVVKEVFYKADISFFERHALMFVPPEQLERLTTALARGDVGLPVLASAADLPSLISQWADRAETATLPQDADPKDVATTLDFFGKVVDEVAAWLKGSSDEGINLMAKLWTDGPSMTGTADSGGYLMDKDGKAPRLAVLFVQPANPSQAMEVVTPFTDLIRAKAAEVTARHPGFLAMVTGMPALATDEMRVLSRDILVTGIIAGLGVLLIFWLTFRSVRVTLFAAVTLGLGIVWASGLAAILYGHLTMISGYFAAQLFGLGVAYSIYIVSRFHEALAAGEDRRKAVETAVTKAGPGVVGSSLTVAAAFGAVAVSEFRGFSELGVIAGCGTLLVLLANVTLLPSLLVLWHPGRAAMRVRSEDSAIWGALGRVPMAVPILAIVLFVAGLPLIPRIGFDYAVENLLPTRSESVIGLRLLDKRTEFSTNYSVAVAGSMDEAEKLRLRFSRLSTVARAESLSMFVPPGEDEKRAIIARIDGKTRQDVRLAHAAAVEHRKAAGHSTAAGLAEALQKLEDTLQDLAYAAKQTGRREAPKLEDLVQHVDAARRVVAGLKSDARVQSLERQIFDGLARGLGVLESGLDDKGFGPDDLPQAIRGRYLGRDNKSYAVIVFPKGDIGNRDFFEKHVAQILSVDPQTTGHPVTHLTFTHLIHKGFAQAAVLAAIAVMVLILLDLRRPREFAMAALPVVLGTGWVSVLINVTGITFNYANLMALPILIGTGVDFGINLAHRARQEGSARAAVRTTGKAIFVSGSAALVGFGSLMLGAHWGVRSLGIVLVMGIASCLVISLVILPVLLDRRPAK